MSRDVVCGIVAVAGMLILVAVPIVVGGCVTAELEADQAKAYDDGVCAGANGLDFTACPFNQKHRDHWLRGWADGRLKRQPPAREVEP